MNKKEKVIYISLGNLIILILLFISLTISVIKIYKWKKNNSKNDEISEQISSFIVDKESTDGSKTYEIDFENLKQLNSDTVAWLKVPGTEVNYTVVKSNDNDYYLKHNYKKEYNTGGWIFADYSNKFDDTDKNIVIYGHNVRDNSMFGSLKKVINEEWYQNEENYDIPFITEHEEAIYRVFSVYKIEVEDYYIQTEFKDNKSYLQFLNTIKERSSKDFEIELTENDKILTLSTCANNNKYRIVLHAKKI